MKKEVSLGCIFIDDKEIYEKSSEDRVVKKVKLADVKSAEATFANDTGSPIGLIVFGGLACYPGYLAVNGFVFWLQEGGVLQVDVTIAALVMLPVALYCFYLAFRKRNILKVVTKQETKKFAFGKDVEVAEINQFIQQVNSENSVQIQNQLMTNN